jgi:hypothetical protein
MKMDLLKWRSDEVEKVTRGDVAIATDALLNLTYNEGDRRWLQAFLIECIEADLDDQVRALAITCIGHIARIDRWVDPVLVGKLHGLEGDSKFAGIAEDALDDIASFASGHER